MEYEKVIQQIPGGSAVIQGGKNWKIISGNEEFFVPSGYTLSEINHMSHDFFDIVHKADLRRLQRVTEEALHSGKTQECEFRIHDKEGKIHWLGIKMRFFGYQEEIPYYLVSGWDIHGRKQAEAEITIQKSKWDEMEKRLKLDGLTGVLNKETTKESIEEFLQNEPEGEHAFFLIDVDNFKNVNDTFGHLFGDSVLVNIAEKIIGLFRNSDIVGRIGGDEFVVFMKHAGENQARIKAQNVCDMVRQEYNGVEEQVRITCSVGISLYQNEKGDYATLFSAADGAMYQAKKEGKNQYWVARTLETNGKEKKEKQIESRTSQYRAGRSQDSDFLTNAFLLLSHAKDVNNSLNLLIERIGRKYDLGAVAVLECDEGKKEFKRTNAWNREQGILPKQWISEERPKWKKIREKMDGKELVCIHDCFEGGELNKEEKEIFKENRIHAMLSGSFSYFDQGRGYVMFCDMEKSRTWSEVEQNMFRELVYLLSVFVAVRRQQEEEQQTIRKLKKRDALTGLYNEEAFKENVQNKIKEWDKNLQYAVVYTDINDFSYLNDNYGQEIGNEVLKEFATILMEDKNTIACRLYSDLFIRFMWGKSKEDILQQVVKKNTDYIGQQKRKYALENIKLSTGIYYMESPTEKLEIAIENANLTRKSIKGNDSIFCRVYEKKLRLQRENEKKIIEEFPKALERGQFKVYIQPQVQLGEKRRFIGGEALIRWERRKGKIACPEEFIPALEKSGDIIALDFFVYQQVLKEMRQWKELGIAIPVISVNFSRKHFDTGGIYFKIVTEAEKYGIPPACIEIEITESLFNVGDELVKQEIQKLRKAGFKVAMDDFGTGYSSLSMLMDVPVDVVKIDKSFLKKANNKKGRIFMEEMGRLIHSVGEKTIVEGIETEEQCNFLTKCGFEYGQGFLFEQPIPMRVFSEKYIK